MADKKDADTKFWIKDPSILVTDVVFFPTATMTRSQKLNALTRLAIILGIIMYVMKYKQWFTFTIVAVLVLVIMSQLDTKEAFSIIPTHADDDFSTTVVAPTFAEEWHVPPPGYDQYTNVEYTPTMFEEPIRPQAYPYGQYLTTTNLLPSDEYLVRMNPGGGAKTAREYVNSTFTKHDLAFRENMTRTYKKSLNRRFRSNNNDTWSPYYSY